MTITYNNYLGSKVLKNPIIGGISSYLRYTPYTYFIR